MQHALSKKEGFNSSCLFSVGNRKVCLKKREKVKQKLCPKKNGGSKTKGEQGNGITPTGIKSWLRKTKREPATRGNNYCDLTEGQN